ncbi:MAG: ABC transporter ATP-binding protein [Microbacteriaceae bacterium]|nr:ABC transporter ATP-binding protein [Microbacteriaceae bacterium]
MKLELRDITKRFGSLVANDSINLTVESGQIHALLGENGAGKSTLMNVLFGLYTPEEGQILLDDEEVTFSGPGEAMAAGIGMVHQHFMLVPVFTVAENVILGHEPTKAGGVLDLGAARKLVRDLGQKFGFDIDPDALVADLPVGVQQRVEIIKALSRNAKILVLDEPTAVLTPQETDELMEIMRELAKSGTSIVFITHKLREVKAVADTITIIRHGKVVGEASPDASTHELATMMVGHDIQLIVDKADREPGEVALEVDNLTVFDVNNQKVLDDVSFDVRNGEILAIAGVQGNGQTELVEALVGLANKVKGEIKLYGEPIQSASVKKILDAGVGYIPEDRKIDGLVGDFSIAENLMLDRSNGKPFVGGFFTIDTKFRDQFARERIEEFDIRTQSEKTLAGRLSGGNQQKVVVARELSRDLKLLLASQPTRGVDVGSIEFIHERIVAVRDAGLPVVIVSTELDEVLALADRIAVMYKGRIVDIVPGKTERAKLGQLMAGVQE